MAPVVVNSLSIRLYKCESGDEEIELPIDGGRRTVRRRQFRITLFGATPRGRTVCLRVTDFRPFFHVHLALPLTVARFDTFVTWLRTQICPPYNNNNNNNARRFTNNNNTNKRKWGDDGDDGGAMLLPPSSVAAATSSIANDSRFTACVEQYYVEETFAGEGKRNCIRLEFATDQLRKKALKFLRAPDTVPPSTIHPAADSSSSSSSYDDGEDVAASSSSKRRRRAAADDAPVFLEEMGAHAQRRERGYETYGGKMISLHAFLHAAKLQPTGWVTVRLETPSISGEAERWSSNCNAEFEVCRAHLAGNPDRLDAVPLIVSSYDGEMGSSHGDFPVPVKDYNKPASQIVEMCARHVHGVSAAAATAFLRKALEHMFPENPAAVMPVLPLLPDAAAAVHPPPPPPSSSSPADTSAATASAFRTHQKLRDAAAAVMQQRQQQKAAAAAATSTPTSTTSTTTLPMDCVYPKSCPYDASDPTARASWIDAMVALLAQQPLSKLLAMPAGKMREVVQTLRVAARFEKQRLAAKRAQEDAEDKEKAATAENAASGEANQEAVEHFADPEDEYGGGGGGGADGPIHELLNSTGLPIATTTFVDVLRAHLDTDAAAKAILLKEAATAKFGTAAAKLGRAAAPAKSVSAAANAPPPILTQLNKTQLLNQLFTLCLPPLQGDPVTFIGTVFEVHGGKAGDDQQQQHIVVVGDCAPIPGVIVHSVPDERALLLKWAQLMHDKRVHVLMSYNGFGFDNKFFFLRAQEHGIADDIFAFSRQRGCNGLVRDWRTNAEGLAVNQCRLASGDYLMERPHLPGVIQIDLLFYFRREHTGYISYSLDSVSMATLTDSVVAMDTVATIDLLGKTNACDGSAVLLDWDDPLTVRPRGDRLLRLETGNLAGLYVGNYICLQIMDGQLASNYLSQAAWRAANALPPLEHGGDARQKIQVLGIQKSTDGKRQCLLVDAAVAAAVRQKVADEAANRRRMLGRVAEDEDGDDDAAAEEDGVVVSMGGDTEEEEEEEEEEEAVVMEKAPKALGCCCASPSPSSSEQQQQPATEPAAEPVVSLAVALHWSLVKDDVPHTEIFRLAKGSADDRAVVGKYCVGDCSLPLVIARKLGVIAWYLETASLCCVDVSTLVFNGQGVKLHSYVAKACCANGTLLRDLENESVAFDGATVLDPRKAAYELEPVPVADFSSLYPSLMAGYNLSPGTRCWAVFYRLGNVPGRKRGDPNLPYLDGGGLGLPFAYEGVLKPAADRRPGESPFLYHGMPGREYVYTWYTLKKRVPSPNGGKKDTNVAVGNKLVCWFAPKFADARHSAESHPHMAGVYPQQALGLLAARQEKKDLQKRPGLDPFEKAVYKLQELVVKTSNNSVYGQLGSATSSLRDLDVAASICSIGRLHIVYTKTLVEQVYANRVVRVAPFGAMRTRSCYVYGDTDSVFFCFNLETVDPAQYPDAFVHGDHAAADDATTSFSSAAAWSPRPIRGRVAMQCAMVLATYVAQLVTDTGPRPMGLAYEKTLMNFFIVSKKKYAGFKHIQDPDKGTMIIMGLQVKKRDSCDCVRDVFGTVMERLLRNAGDVRPMVRFLTKVVRSIVDGQLPPSRFLITKTLKSGYTKPLTIPHNVLADRIEQRAPGTRPKPGDRVTYAFVVPAKGTVGLGTNGALVRGQCIDTLEQIRSAGLRIDYEEYVRKHVIQPVVQMMALLVRNVVRIFGSAQERAELAEALYTAAPYATTDLPRFNAIMDSVGERLVERLIFEPFLRELSNKNNGNQDITAHFGRRSGSDGGGDAMPHLGPTVHRQKRPLNGTAAAAATSTKAVTAAVPASVKLQKKMQSYFQFGPKKNDDSWR